MKRAWIGVAVIACAALLSAPLTAQEFVTDGLVTHYTFDKDTVNGATLKDTFGKNDGKIVGNPTLVNGVIGDAMEFAGAGAYVEIPPLGMWETASVEVWAMENQFAGIQGIVSTWQWTGGKVHFKFEANQIQVDKNGGGKIVSPAETEKWFHITYTDDPAANALRL
ncbi:MAG: hypothetical protein O3A46_15215, partial [Candidatus Poribacteria bacterium]|nr:hypothetical protein [Candidatus Poribacteria bacterium]